MPLIIYFFLALNRDFLMGHSIIESMSLFRSSSTSGSYSAVGQVTQEINQKVSLMLLMIDYVLEINWKQRSCPESNWLQSY